MPYPLQPLRLLRRYALFILGVALLGTALSVLSVKMLVPPLYQAQTSLLLMPAPSGGQLAPMLSQLEPQLAMLGPLQSLLSSQRFNSSLKDMISILRSRRLAQEVVQLVPLRDLPELQREVRRHRKAQPERVVLDWMVKQIDIQPPDSRDSTLRIRFRLSDPQRVARLVNTYVVRLEHYVQHLLYQDSDRHQQYLSRQLRQLGLELEQAERELLAFQKKNRLVSLNEEVKTLLTRLAELEAEEMAARATLRDSQARLARLRDQSTELNPTWMDLSNQLELSASGLQERQREIKQTRQRYERLLAALPLQALELARLERRVTLQTQLFVLLSQQNQAARLEAARKTPLFEVLDPALPAEEPVFPVMSVVLVVSAIMSLCLAIMLALGHDFLSSRKESAHAET